MPHVRIEKSQSQRISLAIIALNEEQYIGEALNSAVGDGTSVFDEIIVVDGGSTDNTKTIAHKYTTNIFVNKFEDDFAKQRNFAISKCTCPWIFMLDADERISLNLLTIIPELLEGNENVDLFFLPRINTIKDLQSKPWLISQYGWKIDEKDRVNYPDWQGRIFKNRPNICWSGRVHERITGAKVIAYLEGYDLIHEKDWERQIRQNNYYSKLT